MAFLIFLFNYLILFHTSLATSYSAGGYRVGRAGAQERSSHIWFPSFTLRNLYCREGVKMWAALCWSEHIILTYFPWPVMKSLG